MAAGSTKSVSNDIRRQGQQVTLTGLTAATAYTANITRPSGAVSTVAFTTDGSGQFVLPLIHAADERGTFTVDVYEVPTLQYTTTFKAV